LACTTMQYRNMPLQRFNVYKFFYFYLKYTLRDNLSNTFLLILQFYFSMKDSGLLVNHLNEKIEQSEREILIY
jgi:hypothetical protein